ncbi:MAG: ComF family protein [Actinobacteria bacterium]|nr:ComF family protein [Actinomycetota bacterium]
MLDRALEVVFPLRCAGCGSGPWPFCGRCAGALIALEPPWCSRCGRPTEVPADRCRDCPPEPVALARAPFLFDGPARAAVLKLKFGGWRTVAEALAAAMAEMGFAAAMAEMLLPPADVVTWVPLARRREAERGYDQAKALARPLARRLGLPASQLLRRTLGTAPQARRSAAERRAALRGAFRSIRPAPASVLLVDDVLTTGATAAACAEALLGAGASSVALVTAARAVPGRLPLRYARGGFPSGSVVARGGSPVVDASRGRNDPRKATVGR